MGPKTNIEFEIGEMRRSLNSMSDEMRNLSKHQDTIAELMKEVKQLRMDNEEKDRRINALETRIADLEQYSRMNDVVISGLDIRPRSYARAAAPGGEPTQQDFDSVEQQVISFLGSRGITVDSRDIEACHILPRKNTQSKTPVIARFVSRKHKNALLKQGRNLKGTNVYINDHLTKKNADIAREARILKKQNKIQSTWTFNCRVFIKLNGTPEQAKVLWIKEGHELERFK